MSLFSKTAIRLADRLPGNLRRFRKDNEGVAALEFAIIAPILVLLFLGTIEISLAVAVDRKVSRVSSAVADLITQQPDEFDTDTLDSIFEISSQIMYPYDDGVEIVVSGLKIDNGVARVEWSRGYGGGSKRSVGSTYAVPSSIKVDGTFLVAATVKTDHSPAFKFVNYKDGGLTFDGASIELSEEMFLRPRRASEQLCTDCNS